MRGVFGLRAQRNADPDGHYQDVLLGERAAGMGGASIALANEATGSIYNPAGIVVDKSTLIQLSMSAFRWRRKKTAVADICGQTIEDDESALFGFPASLGFVKPFGTKLRQAIGLALLVPAVEKTTQAYLADDANRGARRIDLGGSDWVVDRVFIGTLSYALRPWKRVQLGVSVGLAVRDASRASLTNFVLTNPNLDPTVEVSYLNADVAIWNLFLQLGVIIEPIDGLRVGLTFTTPYLRLSGKGRLDYLEAFRDPADPSNIDPGTASLLTADDAEFYWKVPFKLGLGLAYQRPRFTVAADVKLHGAVSRYDVFTHPALPTSDRVTNERRWVVNVNLGTEVWVWRDKLALRAGFFTNFSSQPEPDLTQLVEGAERIDLFGGTFGAAYRTNKASVLALNVQVQYGRGDRARLQVHPNADPTAPLTADFSIAKASDLAVIIGIGGAVDLD